MRIEFSIICLSFILTGCVSQPEYDRIKNENAALKSQIENLEAELYIIKPRYEAYVIAEMQRNARKQYTNADALDYLTDFYKFYARDMIFRKPIVRQIDDNRFEVALEQCVNKPEFKNNNFFWQSMVHSLTINDDGTYKIANMTYHKQK